MMQYEYTTQALGVSSWGSLETAADQLQSLLADREVGHRVEQGWELWQVTTFSSDSARGFILIFRRPLA